MQSYRLTHRINIERPVTNQGNSGEETITWETVYNNVPAEVLTGDGGENVNSGADQNKISARFNIRYFEETLLDLHTFRIIWQNIIYDVVSVTTDRTARREWRFFCNGTGERYESAATALRFISSPELAVVDEDLAPINAEIINVYGVRVNSNANVTIAKESGPGTLTGTLTEAALEGLVTFRDLAIDQAGEYVLQITSAGLTSADTPEITLVALAGNSVRFVQQPTNVTGGVNFSPTITAEIIDANGDRVNTTASVSIGIASGSNGTLNGVTTVEAVAGLVTFANLNITSNYTGNFTLVAFADELGADVSNSFVLTTTARYWAFGAAAGATVTLGFIQSGTAFTFTCRALLNATTGVNSIFNNGAYNLLVYGPNHATLANTVTFLPIGGSTVTWSNVFPTDRSKSYVITLIGDGAGTLNLLIDGVIVGTRAYAGSIRYNFIGGLSAGQCIANFEITYGATNYRYKMDDNSTTFAQTGTTGSAAATFTAGTIIWKYGTLPENAT